MMRKKLLLVEDDRALAELLIWHFEREDYDVRRTGDGEEALLLASEEPPDVIILDWMIEGILGLEVCRRLRRRSETSNVPIIMWTWIPLSPRATSNTAIAATVMENRAIHFMIRRNRRSTDNRGLGIGSGCGIGPSL